MERRLATRAEMSCLDGAHCVRHIGWGYLPLGLADEYLFVRAHAFRCNPVEPTEIQCLIDGIAGCQGGHRDKPPAHLKTECSASQAAPRSKLCRRTSPETSRTGSGQLQTWDSAHSVEQPPSGFSPLPSGGRSPAAQWPVRPQEP